MSLVIILFMTFEPLNASDKSVAAEQLSKKILRDNSVAVCSSSIYFKATNLISKDNILSDSPEVKGRIRGWRCQWAPHPHQLCNCWFTMTPSHAQQPVEVSSRETLNRWLHLMRWILMSGCLCTCGFLCPLHVYTYFSTMLQIPFIMVVKLNVVLFIA